VALPTYGYFVAFDAAGGFVGLAAEGPSVNWPTGTQVRSLRADPAAIAQLAGGWIANRPAALDGIIWYRLPTDADLLNWRWTTLQAVAEGRVPVANLVAAARRVQPGLAEVELVSDGEADAPLPETVTVTWSDARLLAADGLSGYELYARNLDNVLFRLRPMTTIEWLHPGESRAIGWLRFETDTEVRIDVSDTHR